MIFTSHTLVFLSLFSNEVSAFTSVKPGILKANYKRISQSRTNLADGASDISQLLDDRFPTSVDDQVRQAAAAIVRAQNDGIQRHCVRMLLPVIGATELDDWPGGARQMMDAAAPMAGSILRQITQKISDSSVKEITDSVIDESDGLRAMFAIADKSR